MANSSEPAPEEGHWLIRLIWPGLHFANGIVESGAYRESDDGSGTSVTLLTSQTDVEACVQDAHERGIQLIPVSKIYELGLALIHDPIDGNPNHYLIKRSAQESTKMSKGTLKKLRASARWIKIPEGWEEKGIACEPLSLFLT